MDFGENFGQRVDLTARIKEILREYPEGTSFIKELVQNADDACATEVCFCIDLRHHGVGSTVYRQSATDMQGPSLLVYNNALFSEKDMENICRIGDSCKKVEAEKIGRFGLGFCSVYHVTDVPSFVSGRHAIWLDPHAHFLPNVDATCPGKKVDFLASSGLVASHVDQFSPFSGIWDVDFKKPFKGTVFRFPLRTKGLASVSRISNHAPSPRSVENLLTHFCLEDGSRSLLFLTSIRSIKVLKMEDGKSGPSLTYSTEIPHNCGNTNILERRAAFVGNGWSPSSLPQCCDFTVEIRSSDSGKTTNEVWQVCNTLGGTAEIQDIVQSPAMADFRLLPLAGVAALLPQAAASSSSVTRVKSGRAFCTLPLPIDTGLPIEVNGRFEITNNRRSLWLGSDMQGIGKLRTEWNRALLKHCVAPTYARLLSSVVPQLAEIGDAYTFWPGQELLDPWDSVALLTAKEVLSRTVQHKAFFARTPSGVQYLTAPDVAFLVNNGSNAWLHMALVSMGKKVAYVPQHVWTLLDSANESGGELSVVDIKYVRDALKESASFVLQQNWSRDVLLKLLDMSLQDVHARFSELEGFPLLPLCDGTFGTVSFRTVGMPVYFLPTVKQRTVLEDNWLSNLVDETGLGEATRGVVHALCCQGVGANVSHISSEQLAAFLRRTWPSDQMNANIKDYAQHHTDGWLHALWECLQGCQDLRPFLSFPIIPVEGNVLCRIQAPPGRAVLESCHVINFQSQTAVPDLRGFLYKLGCRFIRSDFCSSLPRAETFVHTFTASGVLAAVAGATGNGLVTPQACANQCSVQERLAMLSFLAGGLVDGNERTITDVAKALPIYPLHGGGWRELSDNIFLPPPDVPSKMLGTTSNFVNIAFAPDTIAPQTLWRLLDVLGVQLMGDMEFFSRYVFPQIGRLDTQLRDTMMCNLLAKTHTLGKSEQEKLQTICFVPTDGGTLQAPQSLFDPRIRSLQSLWGISSGKFPTGVYATERVLASLSLLGLQRELNVETTIECAQSIAACVQESKETAKCRAAALLRYLNQASDELASWGAVADLMGRIAWLPVKSTLHHVLPCRHPPPNGFAAVSEVRPQSFERRLSGSFHILDLPDVTSAELLGAFGWSCPPTVSQALHQLLQLSERHEKLAKDDVGSKLLPRLVRSSTTEDDSMAEIVGNVSSEVYDFLQARMSMAEFDSVSDQLRQATTRWIWMGPPLGFVSSQTVVFESEVVCSRLLPVIPAHLTTRHAHLLTRCGVRKGFQAQDYQAALQQLHSESIDRNGKLKAEETVLAAALVGAVARGLLQGEKVGGTVYVPLENGVIQSAGDTCFDDVPWESQVAGGRGAFYVHKSLTRDVAMAVGVKSRREVMMAKARETFPMGRASRTRGEQFGQSQPLTTKLRQVCDMYHDGVAIFHELLQNADDAKAKTMVLALCEKSFPDSSTASLLNTTMADFQGPALYAYNDSQFSEKEILRAFVVSGIH